MLNEIGYLAQTARIKNCVRFFQEHVDQNGTVVIGDGKQYNTSDKSYYNQPLRTGGTYRMGMAVLTKLSDNNQALGFIDIEGVVTVGKQKGNLCILSYCYEGWGLSSRM